MDDREMIHLLEIRLAQLESIILPDVVPSNIHEECMTLTSSSPWYVVTWMDVATGEKYVSRTPNGIPGHRSLRDARSDCRKQMEDAGAI